MNDFISRIKSFLLLAGDIILFYLVLAFVLFLRYSGQFTGHIWSQHFLPFSILFALWIIIFYISGLYDSRNNKNDINFYSLVFRSILIGAGVGIIYFYFFFGRWFTIRPMWVFVVYLIIFSVIFLFWRRMFNHFTQSKKFRQNVLFIGNGQEMNEFVEELKRRPYLGYNVADHILKNQEETVDLNQTLKEKNVEVVVTSLDMHRSPEIVAQFYKNLFLGISYFDFPTFYEKVLGRIPVGTIGQLWFLENLSEREKNIYESFKRLSDFVLAVLMGVVALIISPFVMLLIKLGSRGPLFFKQERIGKNGKVFKAIKFRTMIVGSEVNGPQWTTENDTRVTKVGRLLRKTKIDELPQLYNVLKGDMSFIGPRPEQKEFVENLIQKVPYYNERHLVRPGLTGWAQLHLPLNGASEKDTFQKLQYDLYYIKNRGVFFDISIVLKTINIVLTGKSN